MNYKIISIPTFDNQAKRLSKKYPSLKQDLAQLINALEKNPLQGSPLGNNFYKIRLLIVSKGRGKSGGARVITYVKVLNSIVYLASIYDKSEKSSVTIKELESIFKSLS